MQTNFASWIIMAFFVHMETAQRKVHLDWAYEGNIGPNYWARDFAKCNGGLQSPVHIQSSNVTHNPRLGEIFFGGHEITRRMKARMVNSGKAVQVDLSGSQFIEDGGLSGRYVASQFHFHWGRDSSRGSEHVLNRRRFPMELHVVHFAEHYGNFTTALGKPDGLAVLSFLFETAEGDNAEFETLASNLGYIYLPGQSVEVDEFCLKTIFPGDLKKFYRYKGSLTTPPCHESVIWTIFTETVKISKRQLNLFRRLRKTPEIANSRSGVPFSDRYINDNFRPLQELNGRTVYSSFPLSLPVYQNGAIRVTSQCLHFLVSVVVIMAIFLQSIIFIEIELY